MQETGISFHNQHALVLGLGVSGLAMALWCARHGAAVTVLDTRANAPGLADLRAHCPAAQFVCAALPADDLSALVHQIELNIGPVTMVLRSPGLSPKTIASLLAHYQSHGSWITGELGLFEHAMAALLVPVAGSEAKQTVPQVLGITGTNGKTTVTALCVSLLQRAGIDAVAAGNIGPSLLDVLSERLLAGKLPQVWVLELSSFQLHAAELHATAATVLNLSEDHLDWHADMADYAQAKARIFSSGGLPVLNRDDALVMALPGLQVPVSPATKTKPTVTRLRDHTSFGSDAPNRAGDFGLETVNGMVWLVRAVANGDAPRRKRGAAVDDALDMQRLMPADALRIRGKHNALNALAALSLCTAAGAPLAAMLYGLREYEGEPHRMAFVSVVEGVSYYNDSKGTNVGAALAAITSAGTELAGASKLLVILGGVGKGQNFAPLAAVLQQHARAVVVIGQDAGLIEQTLREEWRGDAAPQVVRALDMADALNQATSRANPGDSVLLSPACASFDMFSGYAHRGQVFTDAVLALAQEAGVAA